MLLLNFASPVTDHLSTLPGKHQLESSLVFINRDINNIIGQYKKDGLAHQRYARVSQSGLGSDILAGNGMAIIGLYRNIFGIQPKYNRLYLEPHLTEELNGTLVHYNLRGTKYNIVLRTNQYQISGNGFTLNSSQAFGINTDTMQLEYYESKNNKPRLIFEKEGKSDLLINILKDGNQNLPVWTVQSPKPLRIIQIVNGLESDAKYHIYVGTEIFEEKFADANGSLTFQLNLTDGLKKHITFMPNNNKD